MINKLKRLADKFDALGLYVEADIIDSIIIKFASKPPFKDQEAGNKFRKWVNDNYSEKAKELQLDLSGPYNNWNIQQAWTLFGNEYGMKNKSVLFRDYESDVGLKDYSDRSISTIALAESLKALSSRFKPVAVASLAAPLPVTFLIQFLALRQTPYNITSPDLRRAMYYVCMAAGSKKISYIHYQTGQKLDPERRAITSATYGYGSSADVFLSTDPYAQLSAAIGHAEKNGDSTRGFIVTDSYNFNLDRDPARIESALDYIATVPNIYKLITSIIKKEVGSGVIGAIEEVLVMYEHTLHYAGFPAIISTISPNSDLGVVDTVRDIYS